MLKFGDLNVQLDRRFVGQRIRVNSVLDEPIIVHDFDIRKSKVCKEEVKDLCAYIDLEYKGERRLIWGCYPYIIKQLEQIDKAILPFECTIVNDRGYILK